jgi:hypothetical protein
LWLSARLRRSHRQHLLGAIFSDFAGTWAGIGEPWLWQNDGILLAMTRISPGAKWWSMAAGPNSEVQIARRGVQINALKCTANHGQECPCALQPMDHCIEALNLTRYTLYMQDYGGPVSFRMALSHPDRVNAGSFKMPSPARL